MELIVKGRNVEVTEALRSYLQKKTVRLERHLQHQGVATVVELFQKQSKHNDQRAAVEMTLNVNGTVLRSEEMAGDFETAIDNAADVLDRQIDRYKGKLYGRHKPGAATRARGAEATSEEAAGGARQTPEIMRVKRFTVEPLDEEEAVERMELLGHDFFAFLNAKTGAIEILYRRNDGGYGLLEPQMP